MGGYDLTEVDQIEGLDEENMDFNVKFDSPPRLPLQFQSLFDCRIQLLVNTTLYFSPGETIFVETNTIIHPHHGRVLQTIANEKLGMMFYEELLFDASETYRLKVKLTNLKNLNVILPSGICCGYLLMK